MIREDDRQGRRQGLRNCTQTAQRRRRGCPGRRQEEAKPGASATDSWQRVREAQVGIRYAAPASMSIRVVKRPVGIARCANRGMPCKNAAQRVLAVGASGPASRRGHLRSALPIRRTRSARRCELPRLARNNVPSRRRAAEQRDEVGVTFILRRRAEGDAQVLAS